jgi:hypothetical protein
LFIPADFYFDKTTLTCRCSAGKIMWLKSRNAKISGRFYYCFSGYLKDCRSCSIRTQWRLGTIEPVFGNITINKGMNRFTLREQEKVNAQWQMYCLVHNI